MVFRNRVYFKILKFNETYISLASAYNLTYTNVYSHLYPKSTIIKSNQTCIFVHFHRYVPLARARLTSAVIRSARRVPEVVVYVEHVGQKTLGRALLQLHFLHFVVHEDRFACYFLTRTTHAEHPRKPLEKHGFYLRTKQRWPLRDYLIQARYFSYASIKINLCIVFLPKKTFQIDLWKSSTIEKSFDKKNITLNFCLVSFLFMHFVIG